MVRYSKPGRDASSSATADESSGTLATAGEGGREGERRRPAVDARTGLPPRSATKVERLDPGGGEKG